MILYFRGLELNASSTVSLTLDAFSHFAFLRFSLLHFLDAFSIKFY